MTRAALGTTLAGRGIPISTSGFFVSIQGWAQNHLGTEEGDPILSARTPLTHISGNGTRYMLHGASAHNVSIEFSLALTGTQTIMVCIVFV